jgi:pilus assembly protein Flp/PilA
LRCLAVPKPNVAAQRYKATWAGRARLPANPAIFATGTPLARTAGETTKGLTVKHVILSFIRNESGAAAAEYALILAIVGAGIAVAVGNLGTAISTAINTAQGKI